MLYNEPTFKTKEKRLKNKARLFRRKMVNSIRIHTKMIQSNHGKKSSVFVWMNPTKQKQRKKEEPAAKRWNNHHQRRSRQRLSWWHGVLSLRCTFYALNVMVIDALCMCTVAVYVHCGLSLQYFLRFGVQMSNVIIAHWYVVYLFLSLPINTSGRTKCQHVVQPIHINDCLFNCIFHNEISIISIASFAVCPIHFAFIR